MSKYVVVIEPSSSGVLLIPAILKLGFYPIVISLLEGDRTVPDKYLQQAAVVIKADTQDESQLLEVLKQQHEKTKISAILPGFEYFVSIAACLSARMGLRGLPVETVECLRIKTKMRERLNQCQVAIPRYVSIRSPEHLNQVQSAVGFPCVLKPANGSGSIHVSKISSMEALKLAYLNLCQDNQLDLGLDLRGEAIVEAYIEGREISVEGYVEKGTVHFISITEKILGPEPYFVEIGHIVSPDVDAVSKKRIQDYTQQVLKALNITLGPFHCELRLSPTDGPIVMEIAARLAGDNICELIDYAYHINLAEIMVKNYLDIPVQESSSPLKQYAAIQFYASDQAQPYQELVGMEALQRLPGLQRFEVLVQPGELLSRPHSSLGRLAKAIFIAKDYGALKSTMQDAEALIQFL